jgi:hypothetical protein
MKIRGMEFSDGARHEGKRCGSAPMSHFLTTGQAAAFSGLSITTIQQQFNKGKLKGFRVPDSLRRRIPASYLREFMLEHKIPTYRLDAEFPFLNETG